MVDSSSERSSSSSESIEFSVVAKTPDVIIEKVEEVIPEVEANLEFTPVATHEYITPMNHRELIDNRNNCLLIRSSSQ